MAILLKCICLTTSDASPLIHGDIHRLKYTYTNLPYKATVVPSPTCPKSTVAFRYWDWKWCQDEQWLGLGNVLALAPRGGHHSLIWVYENVPKTWRGQKKRSKWLARTQEIGIFHRAHLRQVSNIHFVWNTTQIPNWTMPHLATGIK